VTDNSAQRELALQVAATFIADTCISVDTAHLLACAELVVQAAEVFYGWMAGPASLIVTFATATYRQGPAPGPGTPTIMKGPNMAQLTDTEQVTLSVAEADSKGNPVTGDSLTWVSDAPAVVALTPSADGYSALAVAAAVGTANITVTDSSVTPPLVSTPVQIVVVGGTATTLTVNVGTPEPQPAPPAPPAG
jgi:hypothetical protein